MVFLHETFDFDKSLQDIDEILAITSENVQKYHSIPTVEEIDDHQLFMAICTIVTLRIRPHLEYDASRKESISGASSVVTFRQRVLAQHLFVNLLREHQKCFDFFFYGDNMSCVLDTAFQTEINELFGILAKLNSMLSILNRKSQLAGVPAIEWGIGVHYGDTFVSVDRQQPNNINYRWSGLAYVTSLDLSNKALEDAPNTIYTSDVFYQNLKDKYKDLMRKIDTGIFAANIINRPMKDWQTTNLDNK